MTQIYLDYAATTPVDSQVVETMMDCLQRVSGNTGCHHDYGVLARDTVENARLQVANLINAVPRNILFTGSSTESTNLALKGLAEAYPNRGKHIVTCKTEHRAVLASCEYLVTKGYEVTVLGVKSNGTIDLSELEHAIRDDTLVVSIMQVNNETGVIQDIASIGELTRQRGVFFHVDATQSVGKLPIDVQQLPVDLLSFSAHKFYGPKGVGALYIGDRPRVRLQPLLHGGGQERGLRSGTLATHQLVGMGKACEIAKEVMQLDWSNIELLRKQFWEGIQALGIRTNSEESVCVPHILNVCFHKSNPKTLLKQLEPLAVSNTSACNSLGHEPSYVLRAMDLSVEEASQSVRFSFGRSTTEEEITKAVDWIQKAL